MTEDGGIAREPAPVILKQQERKKLLPSIGLGDQLFVYIFSITYLFYINNLYCVIYGVNYTIITNTNAPKVTKLAFEFFAVCWPWIISQRKNCICNIRSNYLRWQCFQLFCCRFLNRNSKLHSLPFFFSSFTTLLKGMLSSSL